MNKKIKFSIVVYAFLILLLVFFVVTGILVYGYESHNYLTKTALKVIPFPAAVINYTHFFSINDLENDLASVQRFYENQDFSSLGYRVDFQTADGQKRLKIKEKEIELLVSESQKNPELFERKTFLLLLFYSLQN